MTTVCQQVPHAPRQIEANNMVLVLSPHAMTSEMHTGVKSLKMDSNRTRGLTSGSLVSIRHSVISPTDNGHSDQHQVKRTNTASNNVNQHRTKVHASDKALAVMNFPMLNQPAIVWTIAQPSLVVSPDQAPCPTCHSVRRHSSSSGDEQMEPKRSPRSSLRRVPETPNRTDGLSPPPANPITDVQKYENIPVPGIIPKSRCTSSPTPTSELSQPKEAISMYSRLLNLGANTDRQIILNTEERLKTSGFYFDEITAQQAKQMLHAAEVGSFLVRISSQTSHFFALSVKTNRGTTSIRISYGNGSFRLDADADSIAKMPAFNCVVALIEYYVVQSASDARNKCVFLESSGRRDTPVILTRPYRSQVQSLKHMCRRSLHYQLSHQQLHSYLNQQAASVQLTQYIQRYPYAL